MTNVELKDYLLFIQTVYALAYLYIWRERKTWWHYLPRPLMARLSSSSYSAENLHSIAFFTKTTIFAIIVRRLNSVTRKNWKTLFTLSIIILKRKEFGGISFLPYFFRRLEHLSRYSDSLRDGSFGVETPVAARFCPPF